MKMSMQISNITYGRVNYFKSKGIVKGDESIKNLSSKEAYFNEVLECAQKYFKSPNNSGADGWLLECMSAKKMEYKEGNEAICQLSRNESLYFGKVLPRGFQKALAIGFIMENKEKAFDDDGRFNLAGFKQMIGNSKRLQGEESEALLADLEDKYFKDISSSVASTHLQVKFGNAEYGNELLITRSSKNNEGEENFIIEHVQKDKKYGRTDCQTFYDTTIYSNNIRNPSNKEKYFNAVLNYAKGTLMLGDADNTDYWLRICMDAKLNRTDCNKDLYQLSLNENGYIGKVLPRGFQKALAIGFIMEKKEKAFLRGSFDIRSFKALIIRSYSITKVEKDLILANLDNKYFKHITYTPDELQSWPKVTFGNTEYRNNLYLSENSDPNTLSQRQIAKKILFQDILK
jgi:hypothetical protein